MGWRPDRVIIIWIHGVEGSTRVRGQGGIRAVVNDREPSKQRLTKRVFNSLE